MKGMHGMKMTGNNDIDFASMMTGHHEGAVAMSKIELSMGADAEVKGFVPMVITGQENEIAFMNEFTAKSSKEPSPHQQP